MAKNKWLEFKDPRYRLQDLGRPAVFIIPFRVLRKKFNGRTVGEELTSFLVANFDAYTTTSVPSFGVWKGAGKRVVGDRSRLYEVSFKGKKRIPLLIAELARIAARTREECIYLKAGQYSCLVYPN